MEHGATADGLPALNRRTLQKAREQAYLQRFRENLVDFPEGEVVPSEHPDFLIKAQPRWIGIELTEYVQKPDGGSPMRAQASCVAILATGGGVSKCRSPDRFLKELLDVRARSVGAHPHFPETPEVNAEQRSQGALIPTALPGGVATYRCSWSRTVHAC